MWDLIFARTCLKFCNFSQVFQMEWDKIAVQSASHNNKTELFKIAVVTFAAWCKLKNLMERTEEILNEYLAVINFHLPAYLIECLGYCGVLLWQPCSYSSVKAFSKLVTMSYRLVAKRMPPTLRVWPNNLLE